MLRAVLGSRGACGAHAGSAQVPKGARELAPEHPDVRHLILLLVSAARGLEALQL